MASFTLAVRQVDRMSWQESRLGNCGKGGRFMVAGKPRAADNAVAVVDISAHGMKILDANNLETAARHVDFFNADKMTPIFFALDSRSCKV
jgi:hypothetical protein